jgi:hypothetical protein
MRRSLSLRLTALEVRSGESVTVQVEAVNVAAAVIEIHAPDTVLISGPHQVAVGSGSYSKTVSWLVEHAQPATVTSVEIRATAGDLVQLALCKIIG